MFRCLGILFSFVLHLGLIGGAVLIFEYAQPPGALQPLMQVELTLPAPQPPQPLQYDSEEERRKKKVFTVMNRAKLPHLYYKPVKVISPKKVDKIENEAERRANDIYFGNNYLKQGNEIRLSLRSLRAEDFTLLDFAGEYKVQGENRILEVRLLDDAQLEFIDHKTGMQRKLHKVGKFIYTYGPDYDQQVPVAGSLTFFPHERTPTDLPSRMMWMPEIPPMIIGEMLGWPELEP